MFSLEPPRSSHWQAPWEKPLSSQQSPWKQASTHVTHIPKSYSELQGGVDVASYLLNRMEQKSQEEKALKKDDIKLRSRSFDQVPKFVHWIILIRCWFDFRWKFWLFFFQASWCCKKNWYKTCFWKCKICIEDFNILKIMALYIVESALKF